LARKTRHTPAFSLSRLTDGGVVAKDSHRQAYGDGAFTLKVQLGATRILAKIYPILRVVKDYFTNSSL
jgi:hypothetical protein